MSSALRDPWFHPLIALPARHLRRRVTSPTALAKKSASATPRQKSIRPRPAKNRIPKRVRVVGGSNKVRGGKKLLPSKDVGTQEKHADWRPIPRAPPTAPLPHDTVCKHWQSRRKQPAQEHSMADRPLETSDGEDPSDLVAVYYESQGHRQHPAAHSHDHAQHATLSGSLSHGHSRHCAICQRRCLTHNKQPDPAELTFGL